MMNKIKSLLFALLPFVFLNGCMNESSKIKDSDNTTLKQEDASSSDSASMSGNPLPPLPYIVNYDEAIGRLKIDQNPEPVTLNIEKLVSALKNKYPEIALRVGERKQDTIDVHIDDATYLTQSIGSTGADSFLAEATYGFTSVDSIKVVNFIFEPGDHAMPGPYDRKYFKDFH